MLARFLEGLGSRSRCIRADVGPEGPKQRSREIHWRTDPFVSELKITGTDNHDAEDQRLQQSSCLDIALDSRLKQRAIRGRIYYQYIGESSRKC